MGQAKAYTSKKSENNTENHPLNLLLKANNLKSYDVLRVIGISDKTWQRMKQNYVKHLPLENLYKLAGLFGISAIGLLYLLERNKMTEDKNIIEAKKKEAIDKLYIDSLK